MSDLVPLSLYLLEFPLHQCLQIFLDSQDNIFDFESIHAAGHHRSKYCGTIQFHNNWSWTLF